MDRLSFIPIEDLPEICEGADLPSMIFHAAGENGMEPGDILVVTHKVVSKAEGQVADLSDVIPGELAARIAEASGKNPAAVQVILDESEKAYFEQGLLISERDDGWYCCNAGGGIRVCSCEKCSVFSDPRGESIWTSQRFPDDSSLCTGLVRAASQGSGCF